MGKSVDLSGKKFYRWNVIKDSGKRNKNGAKLWECECDCSRGVIHLIPTTSLNNGSSKSCGCYHKEISSKTMRETFKKYNTYDLSGECGVGYTSKGEKFYFDLEDYDKIKDYCWYINNIGYVITNVYDFNKGHTAVLFHRIVMNCLNDKISVDHINHKTNDNRKSNLRLVTQSQNLMNRSVGKNNTSGVTGVSFDNHSRKWSAEIKIDGEKKALGHFENFEDAVKARKKAEKELFGDFSFDASITLDDDTTAVRNGWLGSTDAK